MADTYVNDNIMATTAVAIIVGIVGTIVAPTGYQELGLLLAAIAILVALVSR